MASLKGEIKTMAQPLVEARYGLSQFDPAQAEQGVSIVNQIKQRVADLTLTEPDLARNINAMAFTDGEADADVSLSLLCIVSLLTERSITLECITTPVAEISSPLLCSKSCLHQDANTPENLDRRSLSKCWRLATQS